MGVHTGEFGVLVVTEPQAGIRQAQSDAMVVYGPPQARYVRDSQRYALIPYLVGQHNQPRVSQLYGASVYLSLIHI